MEAGTAHGDKGICVGTIVLHEDRFRLHGDFIMYDEVMDLLKKIDGGYEPSEEERTALLEIKNLSLHRGESIPASIGNLTNLRHLDMSNSDISFLPENIGNLTNLQHLDMSNSDISALPESIGHLTNLRTLFLRGTQIRRLPESIGCLKCLRSLNLSASMISELPEKHSESDEPSESQSEPYTDKRVPGRHSEADKPSEPLSE